MTLIPSLRPILYALRYGDFSLAGRFMIGSNSTFLGTVSYKNQEFQVVYKPARGERPLWDFPQGSLARREVAAFLVSTALGWDLVPPTIFRWDGPAGPGSVQLFVNHDPNYHYFAFRPEHRQLLRPVVLFDIMINNADRKGGHILIDEHEHVWLIDHGISFHSEEKLRSVVWDFAGEQIHSDLLDDIRCFADQINNDQSRIYRLISRLLSLSELQALKHRLNRLMSDSQFPHPSENHRPYPWPPI